MGFGDSLLLSMNGTGCSISGSAAVMNAAPAISKQGNKRCCVPRLAGCQKIYGFSSSLETRTVSNGSGKKAFAIRAAKSGSVDAPKSTNSSIGTFPFVLILPLLATVLSFLGFGYLQPILVHPKSI